MPICASTPRLGLIPASLRQLLHQEAGLARGPTDTRKRVNTQPVREPPPEPKPPVKIMVNPGPADRPTQPPEGHKPF